MAIARLRVECLRIGITELAMAKGPGFGGPNYVAKMSPVRMRMSKAVRLDRLYKGSLYKEEQKQLHLALKSKADAPQYLVQTLIDLFPVED